MKNIALYTLYTVLSIACSISDVIAQKKTDFMHLDTIPRIVHLQDTLLMESSGLAFSLLHNSILYTHEDSKCANKISAIDLTGKTLASLWIKDTPNRDWEDITTIKHPDGQNYIYLADIGDNSQQYNSVYIYRFPEPTILKNDIIITDFERLEYQYPDGALNAESLLFDPIHQEFWVITKEKDSCGIYRLPFNLSQKPNKNSYTAEKKGVLHVEKITGGDVSLNGQHIILRSKPYIYYWNRTANETIEQILRQPPILLKHRSEHQSEGITFFPDNSGFVTSTEISKKNGLKPYISIYYNLQTK